jgi:hypothetical protein
VVAHPPCARWSRLAGFTQAVYGYKIGDDGGCFAAALDAVRTYGGIIEHPAYSKAWDTFDLPEPATREGWTLGFCGGWSCYVEQGRYGFPLKKATWLYLYGAEPPPMRWGYTPDGEGEGHNDEWGGMHAWRDIVSQSAASATPTEFRDVLIELASAARPT